MEGNPIQVFTTKGLKKDLDFIVETLDELGIGDNELVVINTPAGKNILTETKKASEIREMYNNKPDNYLT